MGNTARWADLRTSESKPMVQTILTRQGIGGDGFIVSCYASSIPGVHINNQSVSA